MTSTEALILAAYFFILCILAVYGWHRYYLVYLYMKHRQNVPGPLPAPDPLPVVTIQLPIYNEMYVVERLLEAVCAIDYPRDRSRSRCSTTRPTRRARSPSWPSAATPRRASTSSTSTASTAPATRPARSRPGCKVARGEFVAIFDADFVAAGRLPDAARCRTSPTRRSAMVQARWGHLNRDYSLLTQVQAIMLDGHFVLEHAARNRSGRFFNFNGTAGIWRRDGHRRRRRLAARHADRGPRPSLPRAAARLAVRLPAGPRRAGRTAGRDERLQVAAVPLGQGLDPDLPQAAAAASCSRTCRSRSRPRRSSTSPPTSPTC